MPINSCVAAWKNFNVPIKARSYLLGFPPPLGILSRIGSLQIKCCLFGPCSLLKIVLNLGCGGCPWTCLLLRGSDVCPMKVSTGKKGMVMPSDPIKPLLFLMFSQCCCRRSRGLAAAGLLHAGSGVCWFGTYSLDSWCGLTAHVWKGCDELSCLFSGCPITTSHHPSGAHPTLS